MAGSPATAAARPAAWRRLIAAARRLVSRLKDAGKDIRRSLQH